MANVDGTVRPEEIVQDFLSPEAGEVIVFCSVVKSSEGAGETAYCGEFVGLVGERAGGVFGYYALPDVYGAVVHSFGDFSGDIFVAPLPFPPLLTILKVFEYGVVEYVG